MKRSVDIAVIGSGFAGSLIAMIARRLGRSVVLLERGTHPRVVIGESSTPLANLLLEELTTRYDLPRLKPFAKFGSWQKSYPEVACGLKRGFTFYHHDLDHPISGEPDRDHQLLVAASPNDRIADTHWYRADLDSRFVAEAQEIGVEYLDRVELSSACETAHSVQIEGARHGERITFDARFVIDATGPRGFLHKAFELGESELPGFPETHALYNHFRGVGRLGDQSFDRAAPYPIDDAAVHHIFDGGWVWVLQFNNGVTSAGVAATAETARRLELSQGAVAWRRLVESIPVLKQQFAEAIPQMPYTYTARVSFRSGKIAGDRWALMPSAAGFVDPLLSTGFPLTLFGICRLAEIVEEKWDRDCFSTGLTTYAAHTESELLAAARLISGLYAGMRNFTIFSSLSLLYFAAASYSEVLQRLGRRRPALSFLLHADPCFVSASTQLLEQSRSLNNQNEVAHWRENLINAIRPFDVAGLTCNQKRNWYTVQASDLLSNAGRVGASREEIENLLDRSGFWEDRSSQ